MKRFDNAFTVTVADLEFELQVKRSWRYTDSYVRVKVWSRDEALLDTFIIQWGEWERTPRQQLDALLLTRYERTMWEIQ